MDQDFSFEALSMDVGENLCATTLVAESPAVAIFGQMYDGRPTGVQRRMATFVRI